MQIYYSPLKDKVCVCVRVHLEVLRSCFFLFVFSYLFFTISTSLFLKTFGLWSHGLLWKLRKFRNKWFLFRWQVITEEISGLSSLAVNDFKTGLSFHGVKRMCEFSFGSKKKIIKERVSVSERFPANRLVWFITRMCGFAFLVPLFVLISQRKVWENCCTRNSLSLCLHEQKKTSDVIKHHRMVKTLPWWCYHEWDL